jgi:hypothetical protein
MKKIVCLIIIMGFSGNVMSNLKDYTAKLNRLNKILFENKGEECLRGIDEFKSLINYDIPDFVCNVLNSSRTITDEYSDVFLGFSVLTLDELITIYRNTKNEDSFFGTYKIDKSFNVGDDRSIVIEEYKDSEDSPPSEITNVGHLLPLFNFQGDYIVVNLDKSHLGELMIISSGHLANILAPSISNHISDLSNGLKSGHYKILDDDLIYPPVWEDRKMLVAGKLVMDEYGEVSIPK